MATAAATSASEPEAEPKAGPKAEGEEEEVKAARTRRKVLSRAVAAATCKTMGPGWDQQEEGMSESDGDEEYAMASSAESSPGEYEWEYDEEEEKNQLEIERLEEQVRPGVGGGLFPWGRRARPASPVLSGKKAAEPLFPQLPASERFPPAPCWASHMPLNPRNDPAEEGAHPPFYGRKQAPRGSNSLARDDASCKWRVGS